MLFSKTPGGSSSIWLSSKSLNRGSVSLIKVERFKPFLVVVYSSPLPFTPPPLTHPSKKKKSWYAYNASVEQGKQGRRRGTDGKCFPLHSMRVTARIIPTAVVHRQGSRHPSKKKVCFYQRIVWCKLVNTCQSLLSELHQECIWVLWKNLKVSYEHSILKGAVSKETVVLCLSLWQRANIRNASFQTLHGGQFTLSTQLIILNYPVKLDKNPV